MKNFKNTVLAQNKHKDQWNIIENPEIKPRSYSHLTFHKGALKHTLEKIQLLQQTLLGN
jgi:hypothetical protein